MAYATIGIPLGLVMFNSIGERLNALSSIVITKLRRSVNAKQPETTEVDLILVVLTLSIIVTLSGAAAFSHYEGRHIIQHLSLSVFQFTDQVPLFRLDVLSVHLLLLCYPDHDWVWGLRCPTARSVP